ncbi:hypothetical protein [Bacillus sp. JJ1764]|uniref:hypothetical protein n=1 Tax=Bacillus sp. JJ1764 TaxID=3122964 RepID=UPI002FFF878B
MNKKVIKIASRLAILVFLSLSILSGCSKETGSAVDKQSERKKENKQEQQVVSKQPKIQETAQTESTTIEPKNTQGNTELVQQNQPQENTELTGLRILDENGVLYATVFVPKSWNAHLKSYHNEVDLAFNQDIYIKKDGIDYFIGRVLISDKSRENYFKDGPFTLLKEVKGKLLYSQFPSEISQQIRDLDDEAVINYFVEVEKQLEKNLPDMQYEE